LTLKWIRLEGSAQKPNSVWLGGGFGMPSGWSRE
jgi:hypothetical protein